VVSDLYHTTLCGVKEISPPSYSPIFTSIGPAKTVVSEFSARGIYAASMSPCFYAANSPKSRAPPQIRHYRQKGSVLNSGARLYEPQHILVQSKLLRVADPRSENKSGHCRQKTALAFTQVSIILFDSR
jgi:hypothetical protein